MGLKIRFLLFSVAILSLLPFGNDSVAVGEFPKHPNIVIILTDDMGYGDIGAYGNSLIRTPHIDALADRGLLLTNGYVSANVCSPSRAGLLTGRYAIRSGLERLGSDQRK